MSIPHSLTRLGLALLLTCSTIVTAFGQTTPSILFPETLTVAYGEFFSLSATLTGWSGGYLTRMEKDGVDITPPIVPWYFFKDHATLADSGQYTVIFSDSAGSLLVRATCVVTVNGPIAPTIVKQPTGLIVESGEKAYFSVTVTGSSGFTYQWFLDGQPVPGATNNSLVLENIQAGDYGSYTVEITNAGGSVTSDQAMLGFVPSRTVLTVEASTGTYALFIKSDGTLWGTGKNTYGQLGDGTTATPNNILRVASGVVSCSAGMDFSLFVKADGTLWATGRNDFGQLGDGTAATRLSPVQVATGVVAAAAGYNHSVFVKSDGTLWAMGNNDAGQLGDGTTTAQFSPIQVGTKVVAVAAGWNQSLFVRADGTLWAMGKNNYGQLGDGTTTDRPRPVQVAAGVRSATLGYGVREQTVPGYSLLPPPEYGFGLLVKADATLWGMGYNGSGQLGDGTTTSRTSPVLVASGVRSAAAGNTHSVFVRFDGTLWTMGANRYNVPASYYDFTNIGATNLSPAQIAAGVVSATAGSYSVGWTSGVIVGKTTRFNTGTFSLYVKADGTLWGVGNNDHNQLGFANDHQLAISIYLESPVRLSGVSPPPTLPAAPTTVAATDGTLSGATRVTWNATINTTSYEVWRGTTHDPNAAIRIASDVPNALFFDLTATPAVTYYYWIKAANSAGVSVLSASEDGFAGASVADFNRDGNADLLWSNSITGERSIALMNGTTQVGYSFMGNFLPEWSIAATGDFNADGKTDIVWSSNVSGERALWLMDGTNLLGISTLGIFPLEWTVAATGDFNFDGKPDIVWSNSLTGERALWLMNGTNLLGISTLGIFPKEWTVAAVGDFNGDSKPDIVWSNSLTGERALWLMDGTQFLGVSTLGIFPLEWTVSGVGDYNGDGNPDIIWSNSTTGEHALWFMNGTALLGISPLGMFPLEWSVRN